MPLPTQWTAFNMRMPYELRRALKLLSFRSELTMNAIALQVLVENLGKRPIGRSDGKTVRASDDPEIAGLLKIAKDQVGKADFKDIRYGGFEPGDT